MDFSVQNFFYSLLLSLHNITRWLVIVFAVLALVRAFRGWLKNLDWTKPDDRAGILFTSMLDVQLLLGLLLFFLFSPAFARLTANFGEAMKDPGTRFFAMEHVIVMVAALILAHVTRALSKRAIDPVKKHRTAALGFSITTLAILASIPWPFLAIYGRPILRFFGISF